MRTTGLPEEVLARLRHVFSGHPEIESVTLFGSRAKGTHRAGSDVDLCVTAPEWTSSDLSRLLTELDDLNLPWTLDVNLDHFIQLPALRGHIHRVGIQVFPVLSKK